MKKIIIYFLGIFVGTNLIAVGAFASSLELDETAKKEQFTKKNPRLLEVKKRKQINSIASIDLVPIFILQHF